MSNIAVRRGADGELRICLMMGVDVPEDAPDSMFHSQAEFRALAAETLELQSHDRQGFTASMARRVYAKHNKVGPGTPVLQNVEPDEADLGFGSKELPDPQAFYADYNRRRGGE